MKYRRLRLFLIGSLLAITFLSSQERNFHVNQTGRYSMLVESNSSKSTRNIDNGTVEYFVINDEDGLFRYYYSVTSIELDKYLDVNDNDYIQSFQSECGCKVNSVAESRFNNFSGVEILFSSEKDGNTLQGKTISHCTKRGQLLSISFLTREGDFSKYETRFEMLLDSFVINAD
ncbi:MAG: hypothetical protein AAF600_20810 [Bacteroidota bacterium]